MLMGHVLKVVLFTSWLAVCRTGETFPCPRGCACKDSNRRLYCERNKLQNIPSNIPTVVEELYLGYNLLTRIRRNDLKGLSNLTSVSFKKNIIATIENGAFEDLRNLRTLYLTNNKLGGVLDRQVFIGLSSLRYLYLSQNYLTSVPDLTNSSSLLKLNLDNNHLDHATFPDGFKNIKYITTIVLNVNPIEALYAQDFMALQSDTLAKIDLSRCKIKHIENNTFAPFVKLTSLSLAENPISATNLKDIIQGLGNSNIVSLDLSHIIQDGYLPNDTFAALNNVPLKQLSLGRSKLGVIKNGTFRFFPVLERLLLPRAEIAGTENGTFIGLNRLTRLDLQWNALQNIPNNLPPSLQILDLTHNTGITVIPDDIFINLQNLGELKMRGCGILTIKNGAFNGLWNLESLDLSLNQLGGNSIGNEAMANLNNLKYLFLKENNMKTVVNQSKLFSGLTTLTYLDMSGNDCRELPVGIFKPLVSLKSLFLSKNRLGYVLDTDYDGNILTGLISLKELHIDDNRIGQLPGVVFKDLKSLETLGLENNGIYHWDEAVFVNKPHLSVVNMSANRIAVVNTTSLEAFSCKVTLDLTANPFACNCDMRWFRSWTNHPNLTLVNLPNYKCYSPKNMEGKRFMDFDPDSIWIACNWLYFLYGGVGITLAAVVLVMSVGYVNRWRLRIWWYYIRQITNKRKRQIANGGHDNEELIQDVDIYDAYVSYSESEHEEDRNWVENYLMEKIDLEHEAGRHRLFYEHRDVLGGRGNLNEKGNAMSKSRKMILVLSEQYLKDAERVHYDLHIAQHKVGEKGSAAVILVLLEARAAAHTNLPRVFRISIQKRDALEWPGGDAEQDAHIVFWQRLQEKLDQEPPPLFIE